MLDDSNNSDIETQMFKYSDNYSSGSQSSSRDRLELGVLGTNFFVNLVLKRTQHLRYNMAMAVLSLLKILATGLILLETSGFCPSDVNIWLIVMIVYDFSNIISRFLLIKSLQPKNKKPKVPVEALIPAEKEEQLDISTVSRRRRTTLAQKFRVSIVGKENKEGQGLQMVSITRFFYLTIFVWSQFILIEELRFKNIVSQKILLFYIFVTFGYVYFGLPIIFFLIDCLTYGCCELRLKLCKEPAPQEIIQQTETPMPPDTQEKLLPTLKFTKDLPGSHNCGICMDEYRSQEVLVQLKCNVNHHFHEKCLIQWMEKQNFCPTCYTKIPSTADSNLSLSDCDTRSSSVSPQ